MAEILDGDGYIEPDAESESVSSHLQLPSIAQELRNSVNPLYIIPNYWQFPECVNPSTNVLTFTLKHLYAAPIMATAFVSTALLSREVFPPQSLNSFGQIGLNAIDVVIALTIGRSLANVLHPFMRRLPPPFGH